MLLFADNIMHRTNILYLIILDETNKELPTPTLFRYRNSPTFL